VALPRNNKPLTPRTELVDAANDVEEKDDEEEDDDDDDEEETLLLQNRSTI
jgi:hypothetical protein